MKEEEDYFDKTYDLIKNYSDNRITLLKIQTAKKMSQLVSKLVFTVFSLMLLFFLLFFISIMGGYYFAEITGSLYKGFGIVAGIYLFVFILFLVLFRSVISVKLKNMVTGIFFEENPQFETENDEE
jgi:hypothetical protein